MESFSAGAVFKKFIGAATGDIINHRNVASPLKYYCSQRECHTMHALCAPPGHSTRRSLAASAPNIMLVLSKNTSRRCPVRIQKLRRQFSLFVATASSSRIIATLLKIPHALEI
jgi:hypothetical protein